jgi:hypothetical protein
MSRFLRELRGMVEAEMDRTAQAADMLADGYSASEVRQALGISDKEWPITLERLQRLTGRPTPWTPPLTASPERLPVRSAGSTMYINLRSNK